MAAISRAVLASLLLFAIGLLACRRSTSGQASTSVTAALRPTRGSASTDHGGLFRDKRFTSLTERAQAAMREGRSREACQLFDTARALILRESDGRQEIEFTTAYAAEVDRLLGSEPLEPSIPALFDYISALDRTSYFMVVDPTHLPLRKRIRSNLWRLAPAADTMRRMRAVATYYDVFLSNNGRYPSTEEFQTLSDPAVQGTRTQEDIQRLHQDAWGTPFLVIGGTDGPPRVISAGADRAFSADRWGTTGGSLGLDEDAVLEPDERFSRAWKSEIDWKNI